MKCVAFHVSDEEMDALWVTFSVSSLLNSNLEKNIWTCLKGIELTAMTSLETLNWGQRNKLENEREVGF